MIDIALFSLLGDVMFVDAHIYMLLFYVKSGVSLVARIALRQI